MTNILFAYPEIPIAAIRRTVDFNEREFFESRNVHSRSRANYCYSLDADSNDKTITFRLADSDTRSANYWYLLGGAYAYDFNISSITLDRSSDGSSWTTVDTFTPGAPSNTAIGSFSGSEIDKFRTFTETSAYKYWRVQANFGGSNYLFLNKVMIGSFVDLGKDPSDWSYSYPQGNEPFIADSGAFGVARSSNSARKITFFYEGLSIVNINALKALYALGPKTCFCAYASIDTTPLFGRTNLPFVFVDALEIGRSENPDWNTAKFSIMEMLP